LRFCKIGRIREVLIGAGKLNYLRDAMYKSEKTTSSPTESSDSIF
jgi:hypothetical protein